MNQQLPKTLETTTETAYSIGRKLCREAIWVDDFCTWQGYDTMGATSETTLTMRIFGADLYSGLSGIAVFLAELNQVVNDPIIKSTLEGAVRTITLRQNTSFASLPFGTYTGRTGVAYALHYIGELSANTVWKERGLDSFESLFEADISEQELSVMSGLAGTIPVFLKMYKKGKDPRFLSLAARCGDVLLERAIRKEHGWCWQTLPDMPPLTGLAHGAAGIAMALLELFGCTQEEKYLKAALKGLDFEQEHFDSWQNNWHDFRKLQAPGESPACGDTWMHGAPGIALTRLRAYQLTGNTDFLVQASLALDTTCALVSARLKDPSGANYSLCNGLAGNADILMQGSRELNEPVYGQVAQQVARLGRMLYDHTDSDWPSAWATSSEKQTTKYPTPGLMQGLAGTGHFYLRLSKKPPDSWLLIT